jgi:predicted metal-dependent phosphoesterase TrpH
MDHTVLPDLGGRGRGVTERQPTVQPESTEGASTVPSMLRIDTHVHTLASDGVDDVETILGAAVARGLDAVAITDHERMDAAVAAQAIAIGRGLPIEVIVGEEISTRGGHLIGLYITERIRPWHSMKKSIAMIHEQGGLAIIAHPLPPYPLCASERTIRRLMHEADPTYHPDAMEGFNPTTARMRWSHKAPALAEELGIASVGGSDAHKAANVGSTSTLIAAGQGSIEDVIREALLARDTRWEGKPYSWSGQMRMFRQQTRKNVRALRDEVGGRLRRDGTGRDLGYPGGADRPPHFDAVAAGLSEGERE